MFHVIRVSPHHCEPRGPDVDLNCQRGPAAERTLSVVWVLLKDAARPQSIRAARPNKSGGRDVSICRCGSLVPSSTRDKAAATAAESAFERDLREPARSSTLATVECAPSTLQIAIMPHARTISVPRRQIAARMFPVRIIAIVERYREATRLSATNAKAATVGPNRPLRFRFPQRAIRHAKDFAHGLFNHGRCDDNLEAEPIGSAR